MAAFLEGDFFLILNEYKFVYIHSLCWGRFSNIFSLDYIYKINLEQVIKIRKKSKDLPNFLHLIEKIVP